MSSSTYSYYSDVGWNFKACIEEVRKQFQKWAPKPSKGTFKAISKVCPKQTSKWLPTKTGTK